MSRKHPKTILAFLLGLIMFSGMIPDALGMGKEVEVQNISKEQLLPLMRNPEVIVLDVRESGSWKDAKMKIKGAVREDPEKDVQGWFDKYPKDKTLVFYCS